MSDDMEEIPIFEHSVADSLPPYRFTFSLTQHYEYESAACVTGTILHGDTAVGSLKGLLIDRDVRPAWHFFELCDSESQELQEICVALCNADGTVRASRIDDIDPLDAQQASDGGFLHVEILKLQKNHRRKDVGIRCLHALLQWLNDEGSTATPRSKITPGWTLVGIQPSTLREDTAGMMKAPIAEAEDKVARQFARLGFRQASQGSKTWYLITANHALVSKSDVRDLKVSSVPDAEPTHPDDEVLGMILKEFAGRPGTVVADLAACIDRAIASGADPKRANVLHIAAAVGLHQREFIEYIMRRFELSVQSLDSTRSTPLHIAAGVVNSVPGGRVVLAAQTLLQLGAPRGVLNAYGRTPIQELESSLQSVDDFRDTFGLPEREMDNGDRNVQRMLGLLLG